MQMAKWKPSRRTGAERCRRRLLRAEHRPREKKWQRRIRLEKRPRQALLKEELVEERLDHRVWEIDEGAVETTQLLLGQKMNILTRHNPE